MKNGILVPLDGTVMAEQALPLAAAIARRTGAAVHPVLVHQPDLTEAFDGDPRSIPEADRALEAREAEYLDWIHSTLSGAGVVVRPVPVLHGEAAEAIAGYVLAHAIGGVVMTTHARSAAKRLLAPSVAESLRHRLAVPMVLLRGDPDAPPPERVDDLPAPTRVLIGLDGSPDAEAALEEALEVAGPSAEVVLLRVVTLPPQPSTNYLPRATLLRHEDEERLRADAAEYLAEAEKRIRGRAAAVERRIGVHSRPGLLLARTAEELGCDLVAVGSHGRSPLREVLFGSVTTDLLRESRVPVLVTRLGR